MPLTLEAVAKLAGVSRSTISRVVNGDKRVKESTRTKVQEVLDSLNFQPNLAARSLTSGKTGIIGLVIPAGVMTLFTDPYFPQLIQGITAACNIHDYSVMLWLDEPSYQLRTIRQILYGGLLDGVIISSMLMDDPIVEALSDSKMPFILVGRHPVLNLNYLDVNNAAGGYKATSFLIEQGCKRVATITGPQNMIAGYDRFQGYRQALSTHGRKLDPGLVVEGDFTEASGYAGIKKLIPSNPDGVFVASDIMAIGALRALREMNVRVPRDISLIGFDDAPVAALTDPPLTTMRQTIFDMGYRTLETLIEIIMDPEHKIRQIVLDSELVIRQSCLVKNVDLVDLEEVV